MSFENYELVGGDSGSYSGGFSKIITLVDSKNERKDNKVSDLFLGLAVPYWAFSSQAEKEKVLDCSICSTDDDRVIDDDLYNKLLDSIQYYTTERKQVKSRKQKVLKKQTRKSR